ncbi:MAG: hypothetical protein AABY64_10845 [Bdellovibrionota bacterium]
MKSAMNSVRRFPHRWLFLVLSLIILNSKANALSVTEKLTEQNYRTLSGRIRAILEVRFQGLSACESKIQNSFQERFNSTHYYSNKKSDVLNVLDLYLDSLRLGKNCRASLDSAEMKFHQLERKKFSAIHASVDLLCNENKSLINPSEKTKCKTAVAEVIRDLDPHCMSVQVPNPKEYYDGLPCLSGDNLIGKFLYDSKNPDLVESEIRSFVERYKFALQNAEKRKNGIELYNEFLGPQQDTTLNRKRFLAVVALLTSSTSAYGSYIEGYHDEMWRMTLFATQNSEKALDIFNKVRILVDDFRTLREWSIEQKFNITVAAQNIRSINRHDYMSAFLACYYNDRSAIIQKWFPLILGYAYESFDFITHLRQGDTVEEARASFSRDTRRYREGMAWGTAFCRL